MTIFIDFCPFTSICNGKTVQICHRINQKGFLWSGDIFRDCFANQTSLDIALTSFFDDNGSFLALKYPWNDHFYRFLPIFFSICNGKTVQICHRINQKGFLWSGDIFRDCFANQRSFWRQKWLISGGKLAYNNHFLSIHAHLFPFWLAKQSRYLSPDHIIGKSSYDHMDL